MDAARDQKAGIADVAGQNKTLWPWNESVVEFNRMQCKGVVKESETRRKSLQISLNPNILFEE